MMSCIANYIFKDNSSNKLSDGSVESLSILLKIQEFLGLLLCTLKQCLNVKVYFIKSTFLTYSSF